MKEKGAREILVLRRGPAPGKDREKLQTLGVGKIFTPGTDTRDIVDYLNITLEKHLTGLFDKDDIKDTARNREEWQVIRG